MDNQDRQQFEARLETCETAILKLTGMPVGAFERHWAEFQLEGSAFRARYFTFGDKSKPTLVMTHGYATFALSHFMLFKGLAQHFRVLIFDNSSWGGNSRRPNCRGIESPELADQMMLEWLEGFFA